MAEIIVHEDQNAMPTTSETLEDFTSNLSPENAEPAVSKEDKLARENVPENATFRSAIQN